MNKKNVILLIGDCLRAANSTGQTLPNTIADADITLTNCYSPGTWTLPTHTSLYTGVNPIEHGITRPQDRFTGRATVLESARERGYTTALFSENPTFGPHRGFDTSVDYCDSEINYKLLRSEFSPTQAADEPSLRVAPKILKSAITAPNAIANCVNLVYGTYERYRTRHPSEYPHHGERVLSHLGSYLMEADQPVLAFVNLLDPHNPHYGQPPAVGKDHLDITVTKGESEAHASVHSKDVLLADPDLPEPAREYFDSYESLYQRQEEIYEGQIRYMDHCIGNLLDEHDSILSDSLIITTGDHGHLFYEEGSLGHHSSLHPCGVHVPLYISLPSSWEGRTGSIETPLSLVDVVDAITAVITTEADPTEILLSRLENSANPYVVADGPVWNVEDLLETYPWERVKRLAKSAVGIPDDGEMTVYESDWRSDDVTRIRYTVSSDTRSEREREEVNATRTPTDIYQWLTKERETGVPHEVTDRLKQLGYV